MGDARIKLPEKGREMMVQYVLLHHTGVVPEHFDLMVHLPGEEKLVTWRILTPPETWRSSSPEAERIGDHRLAYLEFEGNLSGNRGQVKRVGQGIACLTATNETMYLLRFDESTIAELQLPAVLT